MEATSKWPCPKCGAGLDARFGGCVNVGKTRFDGYSAQFPRLKAWILECFALHGSLPCGYSICGTLKGGDFEPFTEEPVISEVKFFAHYMAMRERERQQPGPHGDPGE